VQFNLSIDLAPLQAVFDSAYAEIPHSDVLGSIVEATGNQLVAEWRKQAYLSLTPGGAAGYTSARYFDNTPQWPFENNPLHAVVENRHPAAMFLELGTQPFDQKKMLWTGKKVKISKDGHRYITIPFEHSRKSLDAAGVGSAAAALAPSRNLPTKGPTRKTAWGGRLQAGNIGRKHKQWTGVTSEGKPVAVDYKWKTSPFQNLVRFEDKQGKTSGFKTFRTISEKSDSDSWMHPGIQASHIAETAVNNVRPLFVRQIGEAFPEALRMLGIVP